MNTTKHGLPEALLFAYADRLEALLHGELLPQGPGRSGGAILKFRSASSPMNTSASSY